MSEKEIIAKSISKKFPQKFFPKISYMEVLRDITFEIKKGQKVALIGGNGSGKTTLLKTLAGIYFPDQGKLEIRGINPIDYPEKIAKITSLISPSLDFQRKLTLRQTLKFFYNILYPHGDMDFALSILKEMHMLHMLDKRLEGFSEGQKAITRIAIGLMKQPEILFLDEVTTGLDINRKEDLITFIHDNFKDNTIVMVDHDPVVVERICDSYILLSQGIIVKQGKAKDIPNELAYKYEVRTLMKKRYSYDEIVMLFPDQADDVLVDGHVVYFRAANEDELYSIIERLKLITNDIVRYVVSTVDLENIYLALKPNAIKQIRNAETKKGLPNKTPTIEELQEIIKMFGIMILPEKRKNKK